MNSFREKAQRTSCKIKNKAIVKQAHAVTPKCEYEYDYGFHMHLVNSVFFASYIFCLVE